MNAQPRPPGKTTIAPGILQAIGELTTLQNESVSRLALFNRNPGLKFLPHFRSHGVLVNIDNGRVTLDVYVVMKENINVRQASKELQNEVSRAVTEMVGMEVNAINIHIEDIDYLTES
ncbi:MAG: Asp23/Gls24 family envelope stress response protein [Chloroflexota bacterium]